MKYFLIIIVFVGIIICCINGCQNMIVERRGGKVIENGNSLVGFKKVECDGHLFYMKDMYKSSSIYVHAYDCGCGEVSSVDSTLCKLYGIRE